MLNRQSRRWLIMLLVGGVGASAGAWLWLAGGHPEGHAPTAESRVQTARAIPITVDRVTPRPVQRSVRAVGTLWGEEEILVTPKVDGRVARVCHDVGDLVQPGTVLLELDRTDHELMVAEAQRSLELELARLGLKELPGKGFAVTTLPTVVRAAAQERHVRQRLERVNHLTGSGGITREEHERIETDLRVSQADFRQAILEAEATLAAARHRQAMLRTALQRLADTRISAPPANGHPVEYSVCQREVAEGELVRMAAGTPLFKLVIDRTLKLRATLPERHRAAVQVGQRARLQVEAYPGEEFEGQLARVSPTVNRASRTFQAEIAIPNPQRRLSPGSFARVQILTRLDSRARTVPEEALIRFAGVTRLFLIEGDRARAVNVDIGATVEVAEGGQRRTWVEIESDLPEGALVATSGQSQLIDGTPVRVR